MKSRASIAGHPLHPIFVTIPVGLWSFSVVCDLIYHLGWGNPSWKAAALYCLAGGLAGAVPSVITGLLDYPLAQEPRAALVAQFHLILNIIVIFMVAVSVWLRWNELAPDYRLLPVVISFASVFLVGISGYLGGELISRHHISVLEREDGLPGGPKSES